MEAELALYRMFVWVVIINSQTVTLAVVSKPLVLYTTTNDHQEHFQTADTVINI